MARSREADKKKFAKYAKSQKGKDRVNRYRAKKYAKGLCAICTEPRLPDNPLCAMHLAKSREISWLRGVR